MFLWVFGAVSALACGNSYTVKAGDTLSAIAMENLGSFFAFQAIYNANRDTIGADPNLISVGMELVVPCGVSAANPVNWAVLPSAATIAQLQKVTDIQILDIRSPDVLLKGVIPGSVSVPYAMWRGPDGARSATPSAEDLSRIVGAAGLHPDQPLLIVHSQPNMMDKGRAALVYWMLKSAGFETLAILQDGFRGWEDAGLPISHAPIVPEAYEAALEMSYDWRADEVDVYGIATSQITGFLLDARPRNVFAKVDDSGQRVGTTLPGARNAPVRPLMSNFTEDVPIEVGVQAVVEHLQKYNADWKTGDVITFCQTGELGALSWFYASELAGLENMRLYPESVSGWARRGGTLFVGDD